MLVHVKMGWNETADSQLLQHFGLDYTEKDVSSPFSTFMGPEMIYTDVEDYSFNLSTFRRYSHLA